MTAAHLALAALVASPPMVGAGYDTLQTSRAVVVYPTDRAARGQTLARMLDYRYDLVASDLGYGGGARVTVILPASSVEFDRLAGSRTPEWVGALAWPKRRLILLGHKWDDAGRVSRTLAHELSHVLLAQALAAPMGRVPRWFGEGVAGWQAGEGLSRGRWRMTWATLTGRLMPLEEINHVLTFEADRAMLAYAQSVAAISFMTQLAGPEGVRRIVFGLDRGQPFPEAFQIATGLSLTAFEDRWKRWMRDRYGLATLLGDQTLVWIGILCLAAVAFLAVRLRAHHTRQRWEDEDETTDLPYLVPPGPDEEL